MLVYLLEVRPEPKGTLSAIKALRSLEKTLERVVSVNGGMGLGRQYRIASKDVAGQALALGMFACTPVPSRWRPEEELWRLI